MTTPTPGHPTARRRTARSGPGRLRPLLVALAVLAVVAVAAWAVTGLGGDTPPEPAAVERSPSAAPVEPGAVPADLAPAGDPIPGPGAAAQPVGDLTPTALRIPALDLDVPLILLGLLPGGAIDVPTDPDEAGWLTASAVPGRTGPAVIAGHVDSATGVAVFTRLRELAAGDEVEVGLSDGTSVRYVVTRSERYPKDAFPSAAVYGPAPASVLRLITCGGTYDRAAGSYEDNLVVYAVPAA